LVGLIVAAVERTFGKSGLILKNRRERIPRLSSGSAISQESRHWAGKPNIRWKAVLRTIP